MSRTESSEPEERSFVHLFNTALRDLRSYLRRTLRHDGDADEVAQEAMLRIWNARETVRMETARPLLFRIAGNLAIDRLREHQRWRFTELADDAPSSNHPLAGYPLTETISAERIVAAREELATVEAAIAALPENCRTALVRSRIDGLKHAEVAEEMGISKSMVEKHVAEAVYRLSLARRRP
jgi:RNA polymerase sigma factor (sigma-70 family)